MAEFLGKGWSFPVAKDERAPRFAVAEYEASVEQGIRIVLRTALGERVMRPDFGCAIHDLVFAPNSAATLGMAEHHVRDALLRWEPRIEVLDVTAVGSDDHDEVLLIGVHYRVRMTDSRYNLVYPFYLNWAAP
jgi:phage baseplate assembly protein W